VALLAELERRCGAVAQVRDPGGVESHLVRVRVRVRARASVRVRARVRVRVRARARARARARVESHRLGREVVAELTSPCFTYSTHLTYFTHCT